MIAPLVLYLSLLTEHRKVLLGTLKAEVVNITEGMKETTEDQTIINIIEEDITESTLDHSSITITENYEKISPTEIVNLNSISEENHGESGESLLSLEPPHIENWRPATSPPPRTTEDGNSDYT